jgi:hypothetical protein
MRVPRRITMNTKQSTEQNTNDDLELLIGINISCPANDELKIPCEIGPSTQDERCEESYVMREEAAKFQKLLPLNNQQCSGDENLYPNKIASFSKALKHDNLGEVDIDDYNIYLEAVRTGTQDKFEEIPLGGLTKFVDPLAAYSYDMMGPDSHHLTMRAAPSFALRKPPTFSATNHCGLNLLKALTP